MDHHSSPWSVLTSHGQERHLVSSSRAEPAIPKSIPRRAGPARQRETGALPYRLRSDSTANPRAKTGPAWATCQCVRMVDRSKAEIV